MSNIKQIKLTNGNIYDIYDATAARGNGRIFYGTCDSTASTTTKVVTCTDYDSLKNGDIIIVKFTNTNTGAVDSLKLNVNNTGAQSIKKQKNGAIANLTNVGELNQNTIAEFIYNGNYWIFINGDSYTDTKVTQGTTTTSSWRKILLNGGSDTVYADWNIPVGDNITENVYRSEGISVQPSSNTLAAKNLMAQTSIKLKNSNNQEFGLKADGNNYGLFDQTGNDWVAVAGITNSWNFNGNANTATQLSTSGTTQQFWRGDNTWAEPFCGFVRPEDFPNSNNPIQDAVNAATDLGKIVLLSGTYIIGRQGTTEQEKVLYAKTITIPDNTIIIGTNNATIIAEPYLLKDSNLYPSENNNTGETILGINPTTIFNFNTSINCCIKNITFLGGKPEGDSISTYPSAYQDSEHLYRQKSNVIPAPLINLSYASHITFQNCKFSNYDSNRDTGNYTSIAWSTVGLNFCNYIEFNNCSLSDCYREGITFENCNNITIQNCNFNMGHATYSYTEIGLGLTNNVLISHCNLIKHPNNTTSIINAMGNDIIIENCYIEAVGSKYGIDFGNETGDNTLILQNLFINNNHIKTHISAANASVTRHNNIFITNNVIDCAITGGESGVIMTYGKFYDLNNTYSIAPQFKITNNNFISSGTTTKYAINMASNEALVNIDNNLFIGPTVAIKASEVLPSSCIKNCNFSNTLNYACALFLGGSDDSANPSSLTLLGCKIDNQLCRCNSYNKNKLSLIIIGCEIDRAPTATYPYVSYDASLSLVHTVTNPVNPT